MSEQAEVAHGPAHVDYRSFLLAEPGTSDSSTSTGPYNGLIFSDAPGYTVIVTGISIGYVSVTVEVRRDPPATVDLDRWDEVIDHSIHAPTGNLRVGCVDPADEPPDLPPLTPRGPGPYRVRVHARGRDTCPDGALADPVEDYLLIVWPAPQTADTIHKQTDEVGADWRSSARQASPPPRQADNPPHRPRPEPARPPTDTEE